MTVITYNCQRRALIMKSELLSGLTDEQLEKLSKCHSVQEVLELARQEAYVLNDEQLACVSGGACDSMFALDRCPICGAVTRNDDNEGKHFTCKSCNHEWTR